MIDAAVYRLAARMLFAPFGGLAALRRHALDALEVREGARILELGCGPGEVTSELLRRGAEVDAVEASATMLEAARRRAPRARFHHVDIRAYRPITCFDRALLAFVLHEVPPADIPGVMQMVAGSLRPGGRLVILDHAMPNGPRGALWRRVLHVVESRTVDRWLALDLRGQVADVGHIVRDDALLAGGRARVVVAE